MKIVLGDNFGRDLFTEVLIAENIKNDIGEQLVNTWNDVHWDEHSDHYLKLVHDDYKLYDGYADLEGEPEEEEEPTINREIRLQIVTKDSKRTQDYKEEVIATNTQAYLGKEIVNLWNKKYQHSPLGFYLDLK